MKDRSEELWYGVPFCNVSLGEKYRFLYQIITVTLEFYVLSEDTLFPGFCLIHIQDSVCIHAYVYMYML